MVQLEDANKFREEDEVRKPEKQTLLTKYQIPVHHLEFDYVNKCQDGKEIEKIFRILKSGEEGNFPDLMKATEERLKILKPNSKLLREMGPVLKKGELDKDEWNELSNDLKKWMKDVKKKDKELDERKIKEVNCNTEIRKSREERQIPVKQNEKRIKSTDYDSWDKYDPDTEILKMDLQDEKVKKEALENQDKLKKSKMVRFSNFATEAEAIYEANSEKERGNECFKAKEYESALQHYTYSIQCKPLAAVYTNRAIVFIKLKKHQMAIQDCKEALKLDSKSFKACLRMAQGYEALEQYDDALESVITAITLDPNNIAAQDLANRLYKICGESQTSSKKRFAIEDVECGNKRNEPETNITSRNKPLKPILKSPSKKGEVIAIPGSSKMPPPYYKVVNSTDPEIIKKEKHKILCKPGLLHMTTIDTASDDEVENDSHHQEENIKKEKETIIEELINLSVTEKSSEQRNVRVIECVVSNLSEENISPINEQVSKEEDKGAGGEPYIREVSEINNVLIEDLHSPYTFTKVWNSVRKDCTFECQAEILRKVDFNRIHEVIGFNLDADMLSGIIHCLHKHFMIPSELDRLRTALSNLNRIPRFQMTLLFLSNVERKYIKQLVEFLDQHERVLPNNVRDIYSN